MLFLQTSKDTDGRLLEMESIYEPYSKEPPLHYHPAQEEYFRIIKGELTVKNKRPCHHFKTWQYIAHRKEYGACDVEQFCQRHHHQLAGNAGT